MKRKQATLKTRKSLTNDFFKRRKGDDDDDGDDDFKPAKAVAKAAPRKAEPTERKASRPKAPVVKKNDNSDDDADMFTKPLTSKPATNAAATERKVSRSKQPKKYIEDDSEDDNEDDYIIPATKKPSVVASDYDEIPKAPARKRAPPSKSKKVEEDSDVGEPAPKSSGSKSGGSSKRKRYEFHLYGLINY